MKAVNLEVNLFSFLAVSVFCDRQMACLKEIIGLLNKLQAYQQRKGIIDPRVKERKSKAFGLLNKYRSIYKMIEEENFYSYAHKGMPFLHEQLGNRAWCLTESGNEPDAVDAGNMILEVFEAA